MKYLNSEEEQALLIRLKSGDQDALSRLYDAFSDQLNYYLQRAAKSPFLAEDVVHDTFLKIWQTRDQLNPSKPFKPYLFVIGKRILFDIFRRTRHESEIISEIKKYYLEADESTQQLLEYNESKALLNEAVNLLTAQVQKTFIYCRIKGLSYKQAAMALGITESTVNKHMSKALHQVREHIVKRSGKLFLFFLFFIGCFFSPKRTIYKKSTFWIKTSSTFLKST
ncbi:RNA polymerase sigma factor [Pedobacter sp. BMA]|uniref:RNA polymerase sigma factor n=1 Tax=Pedobacter sp. BMA TaxID=1663685 RepID=UPI0006497468|nr:RNA polymerase sigma factor [Pedobacter sp. BMA]KLT63962.1 hypothetical protein AB669_19775 [Pedobacter sp. BMA]